MASNKKIGTSANAFWSCRWPTTSPNNQRQQPANGSKKTPSQGQVAF
jgi:hypothetical protein